MGSCASRHTNHKPNNRILFLFLLSCCQQCCLVVYVVDNIDNKTTINLYIYRFIEAPQEQDAIIRLVKSVPRHTLIVDRHLSKSQVYSKYTATHTPCVHTMCTPSILQHTHHHTHSINAYCNTTHTLTHTHSYATHTPSHTLDTRSTIPTMRHHPVKCACICFR